MVIARGLQNSKAKQDNLPHWSSKSPTFTSGIERMSSHPIAREESEPRGFIRGVFQLN
jgi:hypothetical protein